MSDAHEDHPTKRTAPTALNAREVCEIVVSGDGQQITVRTRPGLSVEREVQTAALTALCAGVDPRRAALDQQLAILDRALAQVCGTGELLRRPT